MFKISGKLADYSFSVRNSFPQLMVLVNTEDGPITANFNGKLAEAFQPIVEKLPLETPITVWAYPSTREYNQKTYTDLVAVSLVLGQDKNEGLLTGEVTLIREFTSKKGVPFRLASVKPLGQLHSMDLLLNEFTSLEEGRVYTFQVRLSSRKYGDRYYPSFQVLSETPVDVPSLEATEEVPF